MGEFKEFVQQQPQPAVQKKWKATKEQIVAAWKQLRPDMPIQINPIDYAHKGSTYGEDGIRITGTPQFINSVMARLKEMLNFESPSTKLAVTYRETQSPSKTALGQNKTSYVFYVAARKRGENTKSP